MHPLRSIFASVLLSLPAATAQETAMPPPADVSRNAAMLESMMPALRVAENDLASTRAELADAVTEEAKKEIGKRVDILRERTAQLRTNFRTIATGVEESAYASETEAATSLDAEVRELISPVLSEIREATAKPREMEEMRKSHRLWRERLALSEAALNRAGDLKDGLPPESPVAAELDSALKLWSSHRDESRSQAETLGRQIEEREKSTPTTWEAVSGGFASFWRSRGFNLLLGIGIGIGVFILIRRGWRMLSRSAPLKRRSRAFASRLAGVVATAASVLIAVLAVVIVFYLRGDWMLLTLMLILVLGIAWASKRALPPYIEQVRMMLDLGAVRHGERLMYDDLPWRVDSLNFFCEFRNPDLRDGLLRLPIRDVLPLHSRPVEENEAWFPTREGDWVNLDDGTYGKVVLQSPEQTVVLRLGGSRKTYRTNEYLEQNPENLSHGFRVTTIFGVDYKHLADSLEKIPAALRAATEKDLEHHFGADNIVSVKVELASAGASSLDYSIIADFKGDAASRYNVISRQLQASCVAACVANAWEIPFPQLVVHQTNE